MSKKNLKFLTFTDSKDVTMVDMDTQIYHDQVLPGFYSVKQDSLPFSTKRSLQTQSVKIPASALATSGMLVDLKAIGEKFGEKRIRVNKSLGINNQAGVLLHGIQGSGKSTTMNAIASHFIEKDGAVAIITQDYGDIMFAISFIEEARKINDFLAIIIIDECEDIFSDYEDDVKQLLDGNKSINNVVYLASTNYIEEIPDTIKGRPSRFDAVIDCSTLTEEDVIFFILKEMNSTLEEQDQLSEDEIRTELTPKCVNKTLDDLKHIFINVVTAK